MTNINYKSDFDVIATWTGEGEITPFILDYFVGNIKYTASFNGKTWRNCQKMDEKHIRVFFDNHRFGCGHLGCTMTFFLENEDYPDGRQTVTNVIETNIRLIDGTSDEVINDISMELSPNYQSGLSAYEIALKYGFEGTEEEWLASLTCGVKLEGEDILVIGDKKFKLTPYTE